MPAPQRSKPIPENKWFTTFKSLKPTLFSDTTRAAPPIRHLAWSPLGVAIATASGPTIRVWNPERPNVKASQELRGHVGQVEKVAWNPMKEAELASTGADGTVKLWDVRVGGGAATGGKGNCVQEVKVGDQGLFLTWKPDGTEIVAGRRDDVIVPIDVRMGAMGSVEALEVREGKKLQSALTNQLCFSNSGREVFATTGEGMVKILDWPSMQHLHTLKAHTAAAFSVQHSPNGNYLAVGGGDSLISLWDAHDWVCKRTLANSTGAIHHLSFSFDGTFITGACGTDVKETRSGIDIAHVETGEYVHTIETTNPISVVAWHPLRYWLAYAGDIGGLKVAGLGSNL